MELEEHAHYWPTLTPTDKIFNQLEVTFPNARETLQLGNKKAFLVMNLEVRVLSWSVRSVLFFSFFFESFRGVHAVSTSNVITGGWSFGKRASSTSLACCHTPSRIAARPRVDLSRYLLDSRMINGKEYLFKSVFWARWNYLVVVHDCIQWLDPHWINVTVKYNPLWAVIVDWCQVTHDGRKQTWEMVNKSEQVNPWLKSGDVAASVTYTVIGLAGWQIRETTNKMK